MKSVDLQHRFPAPTACYFELSEHVYLLPDPPRGCIIRFLNDQQTCVLWYLWLRNAEPARVLGSYEMLDSDDPERPAENPAVLVDCGPFEEFIYRWWLEGHLFFAFSGSPKDTKALRELTPAEAAYAAELRTRSA